MSEGVKYDNDKPRWGLLPFKQVEQVVDVLTFGSKKYADDNWKKVPNAQERYFDAMHRHIAEYRYGEKVDSETKKSHLAHAVCCILFQMWFDDNQPEKLSGEYEVPESIDGLSFNVKPTDLPNYYGTELSNSNPFASATFIHVADGDECECKLTDEVENLNKDFTFATAQEGVLHTIEHQIEYGEHLEDCFRNPNREIPTYCYYGDLCPPFKFTVINGEIKCFE